MQDKSPRIASDAKNQWPVLDCAALAARLDGLGTTTKEPSGHRDLGNTHGGGLSLNVPFFSRMSYRCGMSTHLLQAWASAMDSSGIAWLGELDGNWKHQVAPIGVDEPIHVEAWSNAAAIEMQLYGVPFRTLARHRLGNWTPCLPVEVFQKEQLAKKVECLRALTCNTATVGAAISVGAVYDDVRYLIDCGFDYINLLAQTHFDQSSNVCFLGDAISGVESAMRAMQDSGAQTHILLSTSLNSPDEAVAYLQQGIAAVSIDSLVIKDKPIETAPATYRETFGSVLSYGSQTPQPNTSWIAPSILRAIEAVEDRLRFCRL